MRLFVDGIFRPRKQGRPLYYQVDYHRSQTNVLVPITSERFLVRKGETAHDIHFSRCVVADLNAVVATIDFPDRVPNDRRVFILVGDSVNLLPIDFKAVTPSAVEWFAKHPVTLPVQTQDPRSNAVMDSGEMALQLDRVGVAYRFSEPRVVT